MDPERYLARRRTPLGILAAVVLIITGYLLFSRQPPALATPITVGFSAVPESALVVVAERQGYFREEGLTVTNQPFRYGKAAVDALQAGKVQIATATETPVVLAILNGAPLAVVATISTSDRNVGLLGRRDRGIESPGDLRGKRVGVTAGNNTQFFVHALLAVEGIPGEQVTLVFLSPDDMADALTAGSVDAVAVWQPFLRLLERSLGESAIIFYGGDIYTETFNAVTTRQYAKANAEVMTAFLRALDKAEGFIRNHPAAARAMVAQATGWDEALLREVWDSYRLRLALTRVLLVTMEHQARWAIGAGLTQRETVPNFLDFLYFRGLEAVAPERITIVR